MHVQLGVTLAKPYLDLIALIADDKNDLAVVALGDCAHEIELMANDGVTGYVEQSLRAAPGMVPHARPIAGERDNNFQLFTPPGLPVSGRGAFWQKAGREALRC